jgi:hypothetical protein
MRMSRLALFLGLGAALLLAPRPGHAQWQYTDGTGTTKVSQYKLYVPAGSRDAAVWIGPTGIGKPGLSEAQREAKRREEAYRSIGEAQLRRLGTPCSAPGHAVAPGPCR